MPNRFHEKQVHPIGGSIHIFTLDIPSAVIGATLALVLRAVIVSTVRAISGK